MLNTGPRAGGTRNTAPSPPPFTQKLDIVEIPGINEGFGGWDGCGTSGCPGQGAVVEAQKKGTAQSDSDSDILRHLNPPDTKV